MSWTRRVSGVTKGEAVAALRDAEHLVHDVEDDPREHEDPGDQLDAAALAVQSLLGAVGEPDALVDVEIIGHRHADPSRPDAGDEVVYVTVRTSPVPVEGTPAP